MDMVKKTSLILPPLPALGISLGLPVRTIQAADDDTFTLSIKNHRFEPPELTVPAGKRIRLITK